MSRKGRSILLQTSVLLVMSFLLSGCASWKGLMPEKYDGKTVQRDETSIEAYSKAKEIVGESKDLYILEPFSESLLNPSLPLEESDFFKIEAGEYVVGEDFPAGRYQFRYMNEQLEPHLMNNATLRVTDEKDQLMTEELLTPYKIGYVETDLYEGNKVSLSGEGFSVEMGASKDSASQLVKQPLEVGEVLLTNGVWEVGKQLEAGTYVFTELPPGGYLYLFDNTLDPRVFELRGQMELNEETGEFIPVKTHLELTLENGQKMYLKDLNQPLKFTAKDTSE